MSKLLSIPLSGTLLDGRYKVVEILSVKVQGNTYLAEDTRQIGHPKCLVKQLKPENQEPNYWPTARRRFASLVQTLEKLDAHDQIPKLLGYFEKDRAFYLVCEFIEGHPLSAELATGEPWTETEVVQLLQEVLGILEFVRSRGVIHTNIAPDNLIRRASDGKLVLINFGSEEQLVLTTGAEDSVLNVTAEWTIDCPTDSPVQDSKNIANQSYANNDIFALGKIGICASIGLNPETLASDFDWENWRQQLAVPVSDRLATVLNQMVRCHVKDSTKGCCETHEHLAIAAQQLEANSSVQMPDPSNSQQQVPNQNIPGSAFVGADSPENSIARAKTGLNPPAQETEFSEDSAESMEHLRLSIAKATEFWADAEVLPQQELEFKEEEATDPQTTDAKTDATRSFSVSRLLVMGGIGVGMTANVVAILFGLTTLLEASQIDPGLDIFAQATQEYQSGDYKQAVALAKSVPSYSAVFYDAHAAIKEWEHEWNNAGDRFKLVEGAFKDSRWLDVFKEANQLPNTSFWQKKIERFVQQAAPKTEGIVRQSLQSAEDWVRQGDFAAALKVLYKIPKGVPSYAAVQTKIADYSERQHVKMEAKAKQLLASASKKAAARDFNSAVKLIKQIPKGTTIYAKAQAHLVEYSQKRRVKADHLLQQAYDRAADKDFSGAISLLKLIPKGTPAYITAKSKLVEYGNKLGTAKTGSGTSATPAANRRNQPERSPNTRAAIPTQKAIGGDVAIASPSAKPSRISQSLNPGDFLQEVGSISIVLPG